MREPVAPPLKRFIWDIQSMVELAGGEREILLIGRDLMARLLAGEDWLPAAFAAPDAAGRPYLLYGDALERFCVTSMAIAPGTPAPIRQDGAWEIVGVARGALVRRSWLCELGATPKLKAERALPAGAVDSVSATAQTAARGAVQDVAAGDALCVSIHVFGAAIGKIARTAVAADGTASTFISGYANLDDAPAYDIFSIQTEIRD